MALSIWIDIIAYVASMNPSVCDQNSPIAEREWCYSCFLLYPLPLTKGILGIMVKSVYHEVYEKVNI